jgi:hypothetical protein
MKSFTMILLIMVFIFSSNTFAADLTDIQKQLRTQYNKLIQIKQTEEFAQMGFGPGNRQANTWIKKTTALRDAMEKEKLPYEVEDAAKNLISLGQTFFNARKQGFKNILLLHRFEEDIYDLRVKIWDAIMYSPKEENKGRII